MQPAKVGKFEEVVVAHLRVNLTDKWVIAAGSAIVDRPPVDLFEPVSYCVQAQMHLFSTLTFLAAEMAF